MLVPLWAEWLAMYSYLRRCAIRDNLSLPTQPFFSSDSGSKDVGHRLLFVGQATRAWWYDAEFSKLQEAETPIADFVADWENRNRDFIYEECGKFSFWLAFREISRSLGEADYANCLWSNLAKIGVPRGNPKGIFFNKQRDLAARTLKVEIEQYRPSIVIFATGRFGASIVLEGTRTSIDDWTKSDNYPVIKEHDDDLWWIPRDHVAGRPALMWIRHPRLGRKIHRPFWAKAARCLSDGADMLSIDEHS